MDAKTLCQAYFLDVPRRFPYELLFLCMEFGDLIRRGHRSVIFTFYAPRPLSVSASVPETSKISSRSTHLRFT